jgi:hypothetical protein
LLGKSKHLGAIRVANDLDKALAIAQVNKNHATVITTTVNPTSKGNFFTNQ